MRLNNTFPYLLTLYFYFLTSQISWPQSNESYMFPLRPGEGNFLSGTMGELRASHFHAGIDIKSGGRKGLPVYAVKNGYVSRIKVSTGGYGNALYLMHPDGNTTVYAHLRNFEEPVASYVKEKQYDEESFEIQLFPDKGMFTFRKGDTIGYSGNSGSSSGPHLHFEIRDIHQNVLDPLKFNFTEIKDEIPPNIKRIALITMDIDSRINGRFGRFEFNLSRSGTNFFLDTPVEVYGNIGIEILAHDKLNGAPNRNGIPLIKLLANDDTVFQQKLNRFSFRESRNILVHTNYEVMLTHHNRFYKLYRDDGNELSFIREKHRGILSIQDGEQLPIEILLQDSYGNTSKAEITLLGKKTHPDVILEFDDPSFNYTAQVLDNTLILKSPLSNGRAEKIEIFANRMKYGFSPVYIEQDEGVYLWNLKDGLPDSADLCHRVEHFNFGITVPPGAKMRYYHPNMEVNFTRRSLFDTVYFKHYYELDTNDRMELFIIGDPYTPLRRNIKVTFKPQLHYDQEKTSVFSVYAEKYFEFVNSIWENDEVEFNTRNFGSYTLLTDTIPPRIVPIEVSKNSLRFVINDDLSGIKEYRATIDNQWILMHYDAKRNLIWSDKKDKNIPFEGEFKLEVIDQLENEKIYSTNL